MLNKKSTTLKIAFHSLYFIILFIVASKVYILASASTDDSKLLSISKVEKNGVFVSVNKITTEKDKGETDIVSCIDLPSNDDWLPHVILNDGTENIPLESGSVINLMDAATSASSHRCYHFIFPKYVQGKTVKLIIEKLQTTIPESLTQDMCLEAQDKIQVNHPDFVFSCNIGDHGVGYTIVNLPGKMGEIQAYGLINDALTNTVVGPWELDITIP